MSTVTWDVDFVEKPELIERPEREKVMTVAQTIRLSCDFAGSPMPQVSWFKNGKPIVHNGRIKVRNEGYLL